MKKINIESLEKYFSKSISKNSAKIENSQLKNIKGGIILDDMGGM